MEARWWWVEECVGGIQCRKSSAAGTGGEEPLVRDISLACLKKSMTSTQLVISGWTGEGAEEEQLVAENKVAECQDRWRWKENFPGVVQ